MKNILKAFGYGIVGAVSMMVLGFIPIGGMWSAIFLFIHITDVAGWACVLRFITALFALAISIIVTLLIGCAIKEKEGEEDD